MEHQPRPSRTHEQTVHVIDKDVATSTEAAVLALEIAREKGEPIGIVFRGVHIDVNPNDSLDELSNRLMVLANALIRARSAITHVANMLDQVDNPET